MSSVVSLLSTKKNILAEIKRCLPNKTFHYVEAENAAKDEQLRESEIVIADYDLLSPFLYDLPKAKLVQGTWAGINILTGAYVPSKPINYQLVRFTGKHFGFLMSEYVVSNIVNFERDAFRIREGQHLKQWVKDGKISEHRAIHDLTIGILGVGSIGNRIGNILNSMGAKILGFGRRPVFDLEQNNHISIYYSPNTLPQFLQNCDYFINVLPSTKETTGLLNGNILENCKHKGAVFINIGRGSIISEESLVTALNNKWISGAILDVFEKEPLSDTSPLWDMPNVIITPHCSGMSRSRDIAEQFRDNLRCYEQNLPIPGTVDFSVGY